MTNLETGKQYGATVAGTPNPCAAAPTTTNDYIPSTAEISAVERVEQGETVLLALQHPNNNFTMVPNLMLDTRSPYKVSEDAVGYWVSISVKALNPTWQFNFQGFVSTCSAGERVVRKNLDDLESHGWLLRMRRRTNGSWDKGAFWFTLSDPTQYLAVVKAYENMGFIRINTLFEDNLTKPQVKPNTAKRSFGSDLGKRNTKDEPFSTVTKPQVKPNTAKRSTANCSTIKEFNKYNNLSTSEEDLLVEEAPELCAGNNSQSYSRASSNPPKNEIQNIPQQRESAAAKSAAAPREESEAITSATDWVCMDAQQACCAEAEAKPLDRDESSSLERDLKNTSGRPSGEKEEPWPSEAYLALEKRALRKAKPESRTKAIEAYNKLLAKGYSENDIANAYEHFVSRMEKQHGKNNTFYVMTLLSWLTKNTGFKTDWAEVENERTAQSAKEQEVYTKRAKRWWQDVGLNGQQQATIMVEFCEQSSAEKLQQLARRVLSEPPKQYANGHIDYSLWERPSFMLLYSAVRSKAYTDDFVRFAYAQHLSKQHPATAERSA